jgi:dihydrofolate reductase
MAAGDKHVYVMGGGDTIRQALDADLVDELSIVVAPVILGGGRHARYDMADRTPARRPRLGECG